MDCLGQIVGKIADYTVEPIGRQVGYIVHFKTNLDKLKTKVEKLRAAKLSLSEEVETAKRRGGKIRHEVLSWLNQVDEITARTDELLKDDQDDETGGRQAKLKCVLGLCPNPKTRHRLSRNSTKLLWDVDELINEKTRFSEITCGVLRQEACDDDEDYKPFKSRESTFDDIMVELQNPNIKRIGVYGIGGVGKTTIVEQVDRQARAKKLFDEVILIRDVKKKTDPEVIQTKIVEKLGMKINDNESESIEGRASRLRGRIQDKKVLVILDDVWERIDFKSVGLPDVATCKILLTARSRTVLSTMDTMPDFILQILEEDEAWVLFESKAGDVVKNNDAIRKEAMEIAKCCKGLPVLIVTVASALKKRDSVQPWKAALTSLKKGFKNKELTENAYMGIEWSYTQLDDEELLKPLFLLCAITIKEGNKIILADLFKYSMGLGFFAEAFTIEEARNELFTRIEKLKDSSLLIDSGDNTYVRMHDIVKYVANRRIAFRDHHKLTSGVDGDDEGELKEWPEKDFLDKCPTICFPRGNNTLILPEVLRCPALKMFLLKGYNLSEISPKLFEETIQLTVLALENMHLQPLPSSFQFLKEMQTLCLEYCKLEDVTLVGELSNLKVLSFVGSEFTHLPQEIMKLTRLRLLDLSYCYQLQVIPYGVLSSLTRLEDLRMNDFYKWETESEGTNARLLELKELSRLVTLRIQIPKPIILPADLFSNCKLERYYVSIGGDMKGREYLPYRADTIVNTLYIADDIQLDKGIKLLLKNCEYMYLNGTTFGVKSTHDHSLEAENFRQVKLLNLRGKVDFTYIVQRKVVFPNLTTLKVNGCDRLKYLFTSFMARSLVELKLLEVESCKSLEEIVLSTKEDGEENVTNLFTKLESLKLYRLPNLGVHHSLFNEKVVFSNLTTLQVNRCDRLKYMFTSFMARSLVELKLLEVESCKILEEIVLSTKEDGEENMANMFTKLESLKLYRLPNLGVHHSLFNEKVVFSNLTTLQVNRCDRLKYMFTSFMARSLVELKLLEVESCKILEEIVLSTKEDGEENMANMFTKLESLRFYKLPKLGRFCRTSSNIEFRSLKVLELANCYDLESFVSEPMSSEDKDAVEKLDIERKIAKQLKAGEEENRDGSESKENPDNVENDKTGVRHSLFNEKVAYPSLERLKIGGSKKLSTIWNDQIAHPAGSFCRLNYVNVQNSPKLINVFPSSIQGRLAALKTIEVYECKSLQGVFESKDTTVGDVEDAHIVETSAPREPFVNCHKLESVYVTRCKSLKYIFSATVARGLQQLRQLTVNDCDKLNVIIAGALEASSPPPRSVFPKVTSLELRGVSGLKSLYPGMHTSRWPSLKQLEIDINWLDKRVFEQASCSELEQLSLFMRNSCKEKWGPPPPANFFPKLKSISFFRGQPFTEQSTRLFLQELRNQLETIQVYNCDDEMLVDDGSDSVDDGEIHPATTFHHLTSLTLCGMQNLLHLENPKSRSADTGAADPVVPNLTSLQLWNCPKLTSLESSAISFRHLTTLDVWGCGQLKYLFPYSVAKSVEQLTTLKVDWCRKLEVIIATDIDGDDAGKDEIAHLNWRLQSLQLFRLPKLQGFVSGNCLVKVPSSVQVHISRCPVNLKVSPDGVLQVTEVDEEDED